MRDKYPIGWHCGFSNQPWFCLRTAPNPSELAAVFNLLGKFGSKIFRIGADVMKVFNFSIASNWDSANKKPGPFSKASELCGNFNKIWNEFAEIVYHSQKSLKFSKGFWYIHFCYCVSFGRVNCNTPWRDYMSQKYNRIFAKLTFISIKF